MWISSLTSVLISLSIIPAPHDSGPLIIGHRGASGLLPEHTLAAYDLAIAQGADYIEPDLVATRDGVLIARHEPEIGGTTDVAQKFPQRRRTRMIDGQQVTGWFSDDFTLAEIKELRAIQRLDFRDQSHNGKYEIPTFAEILHLLAMRQRSTGRPIGVYIETKHPSYFQSLGLALEPLLVKSLKAHRLDHANAPVFIQSFEVNNLKQLKQMIPVPLVQLIDETGGPADQQGQLSYAAMLTQTGLDSIREYAKGIGPYKRFILPQLQGKLQAPTALIRDAHQAGLVVHPWTFRNDSVYLAPEYQQDPIAEYHQFFELGVDGVFSDFPGTAFQARQTWQKSVKKKG